MNNIVLASHGELSQGLKQTAEMILGATSNIYALSAYRNEDEPIEKQLNSLIKKLGTKNLFVLTDILGGSVNNEMLMLLKNNPDIHLITGMNLPLVISIATQTGEIDSSILETIVSESKNSLIDCKLLLRISEKGDGDL